MVVHRHGIATSYSMPVDETDINSKRYSQVHETLAERPTQTCTIRRQHP
jgi:hypothetical protein